MTVRVLFGSAFLILLYSCAYAQQTTQGILPHSQGWYLPTHDQAGELFVFEVGKADPESEPVVVLHGGPGADLGPMLPVANGLETEFHFVFYDQRGSLRSRVIPDSISMAHHVADLETLRKALGVPRIRIVSHSAGTLLAFEYLEMHPDRVGNLVLVGALPHKNGRKYYDAEYADLWSGLADDMQQFQERDAIREETGRAGLDSPQTPREIAQAALIRQVGAESYHVERWREAIPVRVNPEAARRTRETTSFEYNYSTLLANHPFSVTVINGEFDYTVGPRGSPLWQRLVETEAPKLRLVIIPKASHIVWRDDPEAFRKALEAAL